MSKSKISNILKNDQDKEILNVDKNISILEECMVSIQDIKEKYGNISKNLRKVDALFRTVPSYLWKELVFVQQVVNISERAIIFIDEEIFKNEYFISEQLASLSQIKIKELIKYLPDEIKKKYFFSNMGFVEAMTSIDIKNITLASDDLRKNKRLIKKIMLYYKNEDLNLLIHEDLRDDKKFLLSLLNTTKKILLGKNFNSVFNIKEEYIIEVWDLINDDIKETYLSKFDFAKVPREIILERLDDNQYYRFSTSQLSKLNENLNLKNDTELLNKLVMFNFFNLPKELQEDKNIVKIALNNNADIWDKISLNLKNDKEICLLAISKRAIWGNLSKSQKMDNEIVLQYINTHKLISNQIKELKNINPEILKNLNVLKILMIKNPGLYREFDENIQNDKEIIEVLLKFSEENYNLLSENLRNNLLLNMELIDKGLIKEPLVYMPVKIKTEEDMIIKIIKMDSTTIDYYFNYDNLFNIILKNKKIVQSIKDEVEDALENNFISPKRYRKYIETMQNFRQTDLQNELNKANVNVKVKKKI